MMNIPDPNAVFPNEYKTSCFIKNVVTAPNITVGDYTYYDDAVDPTGFERNNVLFNYPEFGDHLVIGKFCQIASGTKFIMGPANHRISSATTYPFNVFGGAWTENTPPHMAQLPRKGDTIIGSDVWIGRESIIMPGVKIGDGAIIAAYSVVVKDVPAYTVYGGNPARFIKERFDAELKDLLLRYQWWNLEPEKLVEILPLLCDPDLEKLRHFLREQYRLTKRRTVDRPPSIFLRLPRPEHLNLRFVRVLVDAFRMHDKLLALIKRKRPLIFLVDTQRQARFARLRILQQCFANALGTRSFCNENPLNVVLRQTDEAVDLPGVLVLVDIELRLREHIAHHLEMLRPKACRNKRVGVQIAVQPDLHDGVQVPSFKFSYHLIPSCLPLSCEASAWSTHNSRPTATRLFPATRCRPARL